MRLAGRVSALRLWHLPARLRALPRLTGLISGCGDDEKSRCPGREPGETWPKRQGLDELLQEREDEKSGWNQEVRWPGSLLGIARVGARPASRRHDPGCEAPGRPFMPAPVVRQPVRLPCLTSDFIRHRAEWICLSSSVYSSQRSESMRSRFRSGFTLIELLGGHRHHCRVDRTALAGRAIGPRGRPPCAVHQQSEADRPGDAQLPHDL